MEEGPYLSSSVGSRPGRVLRLARWATWAALVAVFALVAYAIGLGSMYRHYDVDELQHAHATWLIAMGDRPFHDFVESHPPFIWYLASPLLGALPGPAEAMSVLRWLAVGCGLGFTTLVCACALAGQPRSRVRWVLAGMLVVLCNARTMNFFLEARPDSFAYCLLFLAFLLFLHGRPAPLLARYATFAFLASTAILLSPKFALLVALFGLLDLVFYRRDALVPPLAGHALGIGLASTAALAALGAASIDPTLAYQLSFGFHQRFLSATDYSWGLLLSLLAQPLQLGVVGVGFALWIVLVRRRHLRVRPFEVAVACFLLTTAWTLPLPYKQYYAPWFVLSVVFVPYIGVALDRRAPRGIGEVVLLALLAVAALSAWSAARDYTRYDQRLFVHNLWRVMLAETGPDARVVVFPNMHPIFRRDVFYAWFSTWDPGGRGQEQIMAEWDPLGYGERFRREGYLADLDRNPPDLLLKKGKGYQLPPTQSDIVDSYMAEHAGEYREVGAVGDLVVLVRRERSNEPIPGRFRHTSGEAVSPRLDRVEE